MRQTPAGTAKPARTRAPRLAALPPTRPSVSGSVGSTASRGRTSGCVGHGGSLFSRPCRAESPSRVIARATRARSAGSRRFMTSSWASARVRSRRRSRASPSSASADPPDPTVGRVLPAFDETAAHQGVDEAAGGRHRPPDPVREPAEGHRLAGVEDVEGGELGHRELVPAVDSGEEVQHEGGDHGAPHVPEARREPVPLVHRRCPCSHAINALMQALVSTGPSIDRPRW